MKRYFIYSYEAGKVAKMRRHDGHKMKLTGTLEDGVLSCETCNEPGLHVFCETEGCKMCKKIRMGLLSEKVKVVIL